MSTGWTIATIVSLVVIALIVFFEVILPRLQRKNAKHEDAVAPSPQPRTPPDGESVEPAAEAADEATTDEPEEETEDDSDMTYQQLIEQGDRQMAAFEYDDAVTSFDSAVDKLREEKGRDAIELVDALLKLGKAYQARDDGEEDEDYFTNNYARALALMEQHWGPFDPRLQPVLQLLIAAEDQNGNESDAEGLLNRLETIASAQRDGLAVIPTTRQWSPESAEFAADGDKNMADHDAGSAVDSYWSGLEAACKKHGNDAIAAADLWLKYGQAVQARDDDDDDEEASTPDNYLRAFAIMQQHLGPYDERLIPVLHNLISFYDQVGVYGKADGYIRRLRTIARHKAQEQSKQPGTPA